MKSKVSRLIPHKTCAELFAPNSHDAQYFFHLLESCWFLAKSSEDSSKVTLHLLPVDFSFRAVLRTVQRKWSLRAVSICLDSHSKISQWLVVSVLSKMPLNPNSLLKRLVSEPGSVYIRSKIYPEVSFEIGGTQYLVKTHSFRPIEFAKIYIGSYWQTHKLRHDFRQNSVPHHSQKFQQLLFKSVKIGDLIASTVLRNYPDLAGRLIIDARAYKGLRTAISMVLFSEKFKMIQNSYVLSHEPTYIETVYKRAIYCYGGSVLETQAYNSLFKIIPSGLQLKTPWSVEPIAETCDQKTIDEYFNNRLFAGSMDLWYLNANSNNNKSHEILDYLGNLQKLDSSEISILICLHSFEDGQFAFGFDGFDDLYDWTITAIEASLANLDVSKVLIKLHPNGTYNSWSADQMALNKLIERYEIFQKITFLDRKTSLCALAEIPYLIAITHHGSVAEELVYLGIPTLASNCSPWGSAFLFTEEFRSREHLTEILLSIKEKSFPVIDARKRTELRRFVSAYRLAALPWYERSISERLFRGNILFPKIPSTDYLARDSFLCAIGLDSKLLRTLDNFFAQPLPRNGV